MEVGRGLGSVAGEALQERDPLCVEVGRQAPLDVLGIGIVGPIAGAEYGEPVFTGAQRRDDEADRRQRFGWMQLAEVGPVSDGLMRGRVVPDQPGEAMPAAR